MEWKDIPGWNGMYECSNTGIVRNKETGYCLKGDRNFGGYPRVKIRANGQEQSYLRHRLVATLYVPNPFGLKEVNHIDSDVDNCSASNLEWCDRIFNERWSHKYGGKIYRPLKVWYSDGTEKEYDFAVDFAKDHEVSISTVRAWMSDSSKGYLKKGISKLKYIKK